MYPYRDATAFLTGSICSAQTRLKKGDIVNEMFWWDGDNLMYYEGCGLIGGGCADPDLMNDMSNYMLAVNACDNNGGHSIPKEGVDLESLASNYFDESYPGCKKCSSGLFASNSGDCDDTDRLSFAIGPDDRECADDEEDYCYTYQQLQNEYSGECLDNGYQARKRSYSYSYRSGEELNDVKDTLSLFLDGDDSPLCPPNPYTYLTKCNASTGRCSYNALSEETEMSCKNDFTDCKNNQYLADLANYESLIEQCDAIEAEYDRFHPWGWVLGASIISVCAIMVIILSIYTKMNPGEIDQKSYETNKKIANGSLYFISSSSLYFSIFILLSASLFFTSAYVVIESFSESTWVPFSFGVIGLIISIYFTSKVARLYFNKR